MSSAAMIFASETPLVVPQPARAAADAPPTARARRRRSTAATGGSYTARRPSASDAPAPAEQSEGAASSRPLAREPQVLPKRSGRALRRRRRLAGRPVRELERRLDPEALMRAAGRGVVARLALGRVLPRHRRLEVGDRAGSAAERRDLHEQRVRELPARRLYHARKGRLAGHGVA